MATIGIGLIGTGFMGKAHAIAFNAVSPVFGDIPRPRLRLLCDVEPKRTEQKAEEFGFERWTTDWREVVSDPSIEVVAITTPNHLHREMAIAALEAGKHVYCEKPMAVSLADAEAMAGVRSNHAVGILIREESFAIGSQTPGGRWADRQGFRFSRIYR